MSNVAPSLPDRMRAYAADHPEVAAKFGELADALDKAIEALVDPDADAGEVKRMLGAWARARRAWCDETGDSLV